MEKYNIEICLINKESILLKYNGGYEEFIKDFNKAIKKGNLRFLKLKGHVINLNNIIFIKNLEK